MPPIMKQELAGIRGDAIVVSRETRALAAAPPNDHRASPEPQPPCQVWQSGSLPETPWSRTSDRGSFRATVRGRRLPLRWGELGQSNGGDVELVHHGRRDGVRTARGWSFRRLPGRGCRGCRPSHDGHSVPLDARYRDGRRRATVHGTPRPGRVDPGGARRRPRGNNDAASADPGAGRIRSQRSNSRSRV
jgi:hypothetical protein